MNQYFLAELPIHPAFVGDNVAQDVAQDVVENVVDRLDLIIVLLKEDNTLSATQLAKQLGDIINDIMLSEHYVLGA